jgi:hypothetical protein
MPSVVNKTIDQQSVYQMKKIELKITDQGSKLDILYRIGELSDNSAC